MLLVPVESWNSRTDGGVAGNDAVEIRGISLSLDERLTTAVRAAREVRAGLSTIVLLCDGLGRHRGDVYSSKQEVVLLGLIIERPAAVEKVALVSCIREGDCETRGRQVWD